MGNIHRHRISTSSVTHLLPSPLQHILRQSNDRTPPQCSEDSHPPSSPARRSRPWRPRLSSPSSKSLPPLSSCTCPLSPSIWSARSSKCSRRHVYHDVIMYTMSATKNGASVACGCTIDH